MIEFDYYKVRCNIAAEEVSDDLYRFCETPLKKRLISSSKIAQDIKFTDPPTPPVHLTGDISQKSL